MGSLIYGLAKLIHGDENWTMAELRLFRRGLVLPFALMGFIWFRRILASYRLSSFTVEWGEFSWLLGSAAFHYSGAFFGHQISAFCSGRFLNLNAATRPLRAHHLDERSTRRSGSNDEYPQR